MGAGGMNGHRLTLWENTSSLGASCSGCKWMAGGTTRDELRRLWEARHPDTEVQGDLLDELDALGQE